MAGQSEKRILGRETETEKASCLSDSHIVCPTFDTLLQPSPGNTHAHA